MTVLFYGDGGREFRNVIFAVKITICILLQKYYCHYCTTKPKKMLILVLFNDNC